MDGLDQEITRLTHKRRKKRKTRSGRKKHQIKSKPIRIQATRGDIRRKSPAVKSPVVISPDIIVPNAAWSNSINIFTRYFRSGWLLPVGKITSGRENHFRSDRSTLYELLYRLKVAQLFKLYIKTHFPSFHDCHMLSQMLQWLSQHKPTYTAHSKIGSIYVQTVYDTFK